MNNQEKTSAEKMYEKMRIEAYLSEFIVTGKPHIPKSNDIEYPIITLDNATIDEWLTRLPEIESNKVKEYNSKYPIHNRALDTVTSNFIDAIYCFDWSKSEEGIYYWASLTYFYIQFYKKQRYTHEVYQDEDNYITSMLMYSTYFDSNNECSIHDKVNTSEVNKMLQTEFDNWLKNNILGKSITFKYYANPRDNYIKCYGSSVAIHHPVTLEMVFTRGWKGVCNINGDYYAFATKGNSYSQVEEDLRIIHNGRHSIGSNGGCF